MLFQTATRLKYRFDTAKGQLSVEQLWDLNLPSLDTIAKGLNRQVKESEEESFIGKKSSASALLSSKLDVVKAVIAYKLDEDERRQKRAENAAKRRRLEELLVKKTEAAEEGLSVEEIQKQLAALED